MVRLEEVEDEEFVMSEKHFTEEDDDDYTDTDSSISDAEDAGDTSSLSPETITERILALRDIVPPATRRRVASGFSTASRYVKGGLWFGGRAMFVVSVSTLFLGVPFALSVVEEGQIMEMEREQRMREMGNEVLTPGATSAPLPGQSGEAKAAL